MVVDFAKRMKMAVVNTFYQKRKEQGRRVTYQNEGKRTQIDYILCRQFNLKINDCKVIDKKT